MVEFLKILSIHKIVSTNVPLKAKANITIEKGTVLYTPILDMEQDYINYVSVYSSPNIMDYMGTYGCKNFIKFEQAIYRQIRIDDIFN